MNNYKKSIWGLLFLLLLSGGLIGIEHQLFEPFSTFPKAKEKFTKSIVRDLSNSRTPVSWTIIHQFDQLQGDPIALEDINIRQDKLTHLITHSDLSNEKNIQSLRSLFNGILVDQKLLIYRIIGQINADTLAITCTPLVILTPDSTIIRPQDE